MATSNSDEVRYIGSPAANFIKYLNRKPIHVSFCYAAEDLRFEIESADADKGIVTVNILGKLMSRSFRTVKATLTFTPMEKDMRISCVKYTFKFERINNDFPEAVIVESLITYISISDDNFSECEKCNCIYVEYPEEECFNLYVKAFEHHDDVKMEHMDPLNKTFTISFTNASLMGKCDDDEETVFTSIQVTVTITPQKNDNNRRSRLKWTIKAEKRDETSEESDCYRGICCMVRATIEKTTLR